MSIFSIFRSGNRRISGIWTRLEGNQTICQRSKYNEHPEEDYYDGRLRQTIKSGIVHQQRSHIEIDAEHIASYIFDIDETHQKLV